MQPPEPVEHRFVDWIAHSASGRRCRVQIRAQHLEPLSYRRFVDHESTYGQTTAVQTLDVENSDSVIVLRPLSGQATTLAKSGTSSVEMVRHLKLARDSAVKARAQAMQMLKALIVSAPAELREQLEGIRGKVTLVRHLAALRPGPMTSTTASAKVGLRASLMKKVAV